MRTGKRYETEEPLSGFEISIDPVPCNSYICNTKSRIYVCEIDDQIHTIEGCCIAIVACLLVKARLIQGEMHQVMCHSLWAFVGVAIGVLKLAAAVFADDMHSELVTMNGFMEFRPCCSHFLGLEGPQETFFVLSLAIKVESITFN